MELEKALKSYKNQRRIIPEEEKILETIELSKAVFILREQEQPVCYLEFLTDQFRMIRKRWWLLQIFLLALATALLPYVQEKNSIVKILGIIAVLFVVLVIPEFWKNKSYDCMQIEYTCLYSLRQIYAARMFLFGMADLFMITVFCITVKGSLQLVAAEVLIQFLFPMLVAACICLSTLCSSPLINEGIAVFCCLLWSVIWCVIVTEQTIYAALTFPVWCILFGIALVFFLGVAYKTIHDCNRYWEVDFSGITNS